MSKTRIMTEKDDGYVKKGEDNMIRKENIIYFR